MNTAQESFVWYSSIERRSSSECCANGAGKYSSFVTEMNFLAARRQDSVVPSRERPLSTPFSSTTVLIKCQTHQAEASRTRRIKAVKGLRLRQVSKKEKKKKAREEGAASAGELKARRANSYPPDETR